MKGEFHKTQAWRRLRLAALKRDGYQCQMSKRYGKNVPGNTVHHILPVKDYPEYRLCLWNLITVSEDWHNKLEDRSNGKLTPEGQRLAERTAQKNGVKYYGNEEDNESKEDRGTDRRDPDRRDPGGRDPTGGSGS